MLQHLVLYWITQYAYIGIFSLLVLGIVGLPVPDEFLLTFVGYLVFRQRLQMLPALLAAFLGSACGITVSFALGRTLGLYVVHRFGRFLRINEKQVHKVHDWFERIGGWSLTFGYFFPGVRHLTAYVAGTAEYEPHKFAAFAYSGALLWSTTFISLGYFLGERWHSAKFLMRQLSMTGLVVVLVLLVYWLWRRSSETRG
jgi:membrane protein DedA with SNARE-associated domain